jgi:ribosome-associated translation inhibitor RaiA
MHALNRIAAMPAPLTLTFRHLPHSGALEASARDIGNRLQSLNSRMTTCHIMIEGDADTARDQSSYRVKIHLCLPDAQIHAESSQPGGHREARGALQAAYENAKRQLEKLKRPPSILYPHPQ